MTVSQRLEAIRTALETWRAEKRSIIAHPDFSGIKKTNDVKLARLKADAKLTKALQGAWVEAKAQDRRNSLAIVSARAEYSKAYDSGAMLYAAQRIPSELTNIHNAQELQAVVDRIARSGDVNLQRAFREVGPGMIAEKFAGSSFVTEANGISRKLVKESHLDADTPAVVTAQETASALVEVILDLFDLTVETANEFGHPFGPMVAATQNPFAEMLSGVKIDKWSEGQETTISVEFVEPADREGGVKLPPGFQNKPIGKGWINQPLS